MTKEMFSGEFCLSGYIFAQSVESELESRKNMHPSFAYYSILKTEATSSSKDRFALNALNTAVYQRTEFSIIRTF
jgi:hypothetical protein